MRWAPTATLLVLAGVTATSRNGNASDVHQAIASDIILHRFSVAKGGDGLVIPVRFGGRDHPFLLDTGSAQSLFDRALPLGKPQANEIERTPGGLIAVAVHSPPVASFGSLPCRFARFVSSADLGLVREMSGLPIEGLLGMDVLGEHIVRIDFDRGEVDLLKSSPADAETEIPMQWEMGDAPRVTGFLTGSEKLRMLIDTGDIGFAAGAINEQVARKLIAGNSLRELGTMVGLNLSGASSRSILEGELLAVGGVTLTKPEFVSTKDENRLGLGFWSRFKVTFDFPGRRIFLSKGTNHDRRISRKTVGMSLMLKGNATVVVEVAKSSPAMQAGVREGDTLLKFGDLRAGQASLFEFKAALSTTTPTECVIRRGLIEQRLIINGSQ